jgi:hypothetical protein
MRLGWLNRLLLLKLWFRWRRGSATRGSRRTLARRRGGNWRVTLGRFAPNLAAGPVEIIGAPRRRAERFALDQSARGERIDCSRPRSRTAQ